MKINKFFTLALVVAAFLASANAVLSQDFGKKTPEERAQKRADKMQKKLSLNDYQYKMVYSAFLSQAQQMDALRSSEGDKGAKKEQMRSIRESTNATIMGVLDKEQAAKFEQFKKERKEKHMNKKKTKKHKRQKKS